MAASDSTPLPIKNQALQITFGMWLTTGLVNSGAAGLDSEVSKDNGAFADCTNEATEIGSSGTYTLDLTSTEMNADVVAIQVKSSTTNAITYKLTIYPSSLGKIQVDVRSLLGTAWLTPGVAGTPDVNAKLIGATAQTGRDLGASVLLSSGTGTGQVLLSSGKVSVPDTQKVDVETIKTNPVVSGGTITFPTNQTVASAANVSAVETDTQDIQARLPAALVSGRMDSNMQAAANDVITASVIAAGAIDRATFAADTGLQTIRSNTAAAGSGTTIELDASASSVDDFYNNTIIFITGGTGVGQARFISDYVGATKVATVPTWATNPDNTSTFAILPFGSIPGATAPTAAEVADAVWDEATAGHTTSGTFGEQCKTDVDAIKLKTDNLPAAPAAVGDIPTANQNADAWTDRNVAGGSSAGRTNGEALAFLRNRWTVSGGVLTVYDTDDTTVLWTGAITSDPTAEPIIGSNPT